MLLLTDRKLAIVTGILFIVATGSGLVGSSIIGSRLNAADFLTAISLDQSRVLLSVIFKFLAAATSAGIAISLYPVLRRHGEGLALGSVCFRLAEGIFYLVADLGLLALVPLGVEYVKAGATLAPQLLLAGSVIRAVGEWSGFVLGVFAFCLGASMYYWVLFRTRLVPRWLSLWGLVALALLLTMAILGLLGGVPRPSGMMLVLALPLAAQELVLALWLIAKGFNQAAVRP